MRHIRVRGLLVVAAIAITPATEASAQVDKSGRPSATPSASKTSPPARKAPPPAPGGTAAGRAPALSGVNPFPWVYVVLHMDQWVLYKERNWPDNVEVPHKEGGFRELSVVVLNGTSELTQLRVHGFDRKGKLVSSWKTQIKPGEAREELRWSNVKWTTQVQSFDLVTVIISSEHPLHVDAMTSTAHAKAPTFICDKEDPEDCHKYQPPQMYAKRTLPVKEIDCAAAATQQGWFCSAWRQTIVGNGSSPPPKPGKVELPSLREPNKAR